MAFTSKTLTRSNIISITGAVQNDYLGQTAIVPIRRGGYSNYVINSSSGNTVGQAGYDGGDRVIGFPNGFEVDGDLLFTTGWGDGFAVRRLNNDGTLTLLYHDNNFLYRDSTSTYNHMQSVAISTTQKKGVVMTYNVDGYTTFDYSGLINGGTTFTKDSRPSHTNPQRFIGGAGNSGLNISSAGLYYTSGLVGAGDWIYVGEYDARHYRRVLRRNMSTGVEEVIGNSSGTAGLKSGSANIDRSGYRYTLFYDEVNDRVFYFSYYNGNFILVEDASTSSPSMVWCDIADAGHGDDGYEQGLFIIDPVNNKNRMWIGGSSRILDIDITPCFSGNTPTIHNVIYVESSNSNIPFGNLFRFGTKYQKTSGTPMDKDPEYLNYITTHADRGRNMLGGFVDIDNNKTPGVLRHDNTTEDTTTGGRGRSVRKDYSSPAVLMSSANGTKYWVSMGYGYDGHRFIIYNENIYPERLVGDWEVIYGTLTLANSANVDMVHIISANSFTIPSNCSLTFYVSNNNGSTWEYYDKNSSNAHVFNSSGTQLRIKIVASGHPNKSPYRLGYEPHLGVSYGSMHDAAKDTNIKYKVTRKRLRS